ncbi:hypothetical protein AVEN_181525-1 [Araneus ventricosus]|uniref:EF-hand domain-containing protein n=1 Tax=Araneus ventricosus TaxID=182803 RepID=A0A4Y2F1M2_ARAVE|nr:hypothetical protein AVEN_181525-1 [Araneus ventricosus]
MNRVFGGIDDNGNGVLSFEEGLRDSGFDRSMDDFEMEELFQTFDRDNSGYISYDEFLRAIRLYLKLQEENERYKRALGETRSLLRGAEDQIAEWRTVIQDLTYTLETERLPLSRVIVEIRRLSVQPSLNDAAFRRMICEAWYSVTGDGSAIYWYSSGGPQ